jgi:Fic family protein
MLIIFYLWKENQLEKPVLFLSSFFKKHQELYYEKLLGYHNGDVAGWIDFFLEGVIEIAEEAIVTVSKITALREQDILKIQTLGKRSSESASLVLPRLYQQPIVNVSTVQNWTGFTRGGAQTVINRFVSIGILKAKDEGRKYAQSYVYDEYIKIFTQSH